MRKLEINLDTISYDIIIEAGILAKLSSYIANVYKNKRVYILTDDVVASLYLDKVSEELSKAYEVKSVIIPHGEESKSLKVYEDVCKKLLELDIKRNELMIALGGGVIGDLCGFISSTLYRGLPYVGVPTTLLSQVDSSIGGKTGIDFFGRKNILGCFKQPSAVFIDPNTLKTLSDKEFSSGMGELIKHGAIGNINLLNLLKNKPEINEDIIYESLTVKKRAVELDVYDQNERMTLNFGHTFGHALELEMGLKHGEAVALGMLMAIKLGEDLGVTSKECYSVIEDILKHYNLPYKLYDYKKYLHEIIYDKKNIAGVVNFIFLTSLGKCMIYKINESDLGKLA